MVLSLKEKLYNVEIAEHECGEVSKELVVYFTDMKKAIILNRSGSLIWKYLTETSDDESVADLNIARRLQLTYDLPDEKMDLLLDDVYKTVMKLSEEQAISLNEVEG